MKLKTMPIEIEIESTGSFNDVLFDFTNTIRKIAGEIPDINISFKGKVSIAYSPENKNNPYSLENLLYPDVQYRDNAKLVSMIDKRIDRLRKDGAISCKETLR
jgi:hypothetical protein